MATSPHPAAAPSAEPARIPATDGFPIPATLFTPAGESPERVVLVAPATGVRRRLYDAFARSLAARGMGVVTWDWRGTGESRPERMRGFQASMSDWARRDLPGVIDWAGGRFPDARLFAAGHSFGGQGIGLAPNADRLRGVVLIAAQSGWWGHWPRGQRWKYALLWHAVMPPMTRALGYFPFRRLGMGEDLPRGVALEWARWCRSPEYLGDWSGHERLRAPLLAIGFSDDPFAPRDAVAALVDRYGSAEKEHRHIVPADAGAARIGHFGFFREGVTPGLWADVADWLQAR
jgi:predicted alpha/beta hydrolase